MQSNSAASVLPDSINHLIDRNTFRFRQQEHDEETHDNDPSGEEQEDADLHVAHHGQESLGDYEGEEPGRRTRRCRPLPLLHGKEYIRSSRLLLERFVVSFLKNWIENI